MAQLKMLRDNSKLNERHLPKDYKFEFFKGAEEEINDWLNICINGLTPDTNKKWFDDCIVNYPDLVPEKDLFFVLL